MVSSTIVSTALNDIIKELNRYQSNYGNGSFPSNFFQYSNDIHFGDYAPWESGFWTTKGQESFSRTAAKNFIDPASTWENLLGTDIFGVRKKKKQQMPTYDPQIEQDLLQQQSLNQRVNNRQALQKLAMDNAAFNRSLYYGGY